MDEKDIEVLPDGRIALILHDGRLERGMSTHEVKHTFIDLIPTVRGAVSVLENAVRISQHTKRLELK